MGGSVAAGRCSRIAEGREKVFGIVRAGAMRYAAPVAMPAGLGEWLGAELEARGVEAASLYARAVLSILLHSENDVDLMERELEQQQHFGIHPRAALELELRLERHNKEKETRRGRTGKKSTVSTASANASAVKSGANSGHLKSGQRSSNMPASHRFVKHVPSSTHLPPLRGYMKH